MRKPMILLAATALYTLPGCATAAPLQADTRTAAATPDLAAFNRIVAEDYVAPFRAGDIDRWMKIFAPDAVALHNRVPAAPGATAIRAFGTFVADHVVVDSMTVTLEALEVHGDWAYSWGRYDSVLLLKPDRRPMPGHARLGKVFFLWERQPDGMWKIKVDMGNELPPSAR